MFLEWLDRVILVCGITAASIGFIICTGTLVYMIVSILISII